MASSDFDLNILGTSFIITVDEDLDYLNNILVQYREAVENTKENFNIKEPLTAAILTGFILNEELHRLKEQIEYQQAASEHEGREAAERTNTIIARINKVLEGTPPEET